MHAPLIPTVSAVRRTLTAMAGHRKSGEPKPPADRPASGIPAKGVWPPFREGNEFALRHGARSDRVVTPVGEAIRAKLLEEEPWLAKYPEAVAALCAMEARVDLLRLARLTRPDGSLINGHDIARFESIAAQMRARLGLTPSTSHLREPAPLQLEYDKISETILPFVVEVLGAITDVCAADPAHALALRDWSLAALEARVGALAEGVEPQPTPPPPSPTRPGPGREPPSWATSPPSPPRRSPHRLAIAPAESDIVDAEIVGDDEPDEEEARLDQQLATLRRMTR
jgi:hypothetical protein